MSETLTISADQLRSINRQLAELRQMYSAHDLINRAEAIKLRGVEPITFSTDVSKGKIRVVSINKKTKQKFFSRSEILGLKD